MKTVMEACRGLTFGLFWLHIWFLRCIRVQVTVTDIQHSNWTDSQIVFNYSSTEIFYGANLVLSKWQCFQLGRSQEGSLVSMPSSLSFFQIDRSVAKKHGQVSIDFRWFPFRPWHQMSGRKKKNDSDPGIDPWVVETWATEAASCHPRAGSCCQVSSMLLFQAQEDIDRW